MFGRVRALANSTTPRVVAAAHRPAGAADGVGPWAGDAESPVTPRPRRPARGRIPERALRQRSPVDPLRHIFMTPSDNQSNVDQHNPMMSGCYGATDHALRRCTKVATAMVCAGEAGVWSGCEKERVSIDGEGRMRERRLSPCASVVPLVEIRRASRPGGTRGRSGVPVRGRSDTCAHRPRRARSRERRCLRPATRARLPPGRVRAPLRFAEVADAIRYQSDRDGEGTSSRCSAPR